MTNGEKYKTARDRAKAFGKYCDDRFLHNNTCSVAGCRKCLLDWLDLEAEDKKPLPCPFCGGECKFEVAYVKCSRCNYTSRAHLKREDAIAAHNRVAKKCMEVKE